MPANRASSHTIADDAASAEDVLYRVLLGAPKALHIPVFALGVEAKRKDVEFSVSTALDALKTVLSGNAARAVDSGRYGLYLLIEARQRRGRVALYSKWLAFSDLRSADAFIRDYPRLGLENIQTATESAVLSREAQIHNGAGSGRYDLGPLEHRARLNRAKEYIRITEELEKLRDDLSALKRLRDALPGTSTVASVG